MVIFGRSATVAGLAVLALAAAQTPMPSSPDVCCPARDVRSSARQMKARLRHTVPVLPPPLEAPKDCTHGGSIGPDVGSRYRQDLAFGSDEWARTYATTSTPSKAPTADVS